MSSPGTFNTYGGYMSRLWNQSQQPDLHTFSHLVAADGYWMQKPDAELMARARDRPVGPEHKLFVEKQQKQMRKGLRKQRRKT